MNFTRVFFLSPFVALMVFNSFVFASEAENTAQLGADGFSLEMNDPRYTKLKTYLVEMKNGVLTPAELVVPEKTKFRLVVRNLGNKPAEFESNQLRQEKVLFMNAETTLVIIPLDVGTYDYFDDFAPATHGKIVVKAKD